MDMIAEILMPLRDRLISWGHRRDGITPILELKGREEILQ